MSLFNLFNLFSNGLNIKGSDKSDLIIGSFGHDKIAGNDGDDLIFGLLGNDKLAGGQGDDTIFGGRGRDTVEGGDGEDHLYGGAGNDRVVGNKGNDKMFGGAGNDKLVWNNGDGSDLMNGGTGYDKVQVNFDTDLVNDDLQNKDVAEFSVTDTGVQFARTEVNDQSERGLFQLDIRETEALETNFGGGDDTAVITGDVLKKIALHLDGGEGVDTLDLSQVDAGLYVDLAQNKLAKSVAENFENVIGTEYRDFLRGDAEDNVISGLGGDDHLGGKDGDDTLIGNKGNDAVFGGEGNDLLIWNNGDGSDLMHGGKGYDTLQINFDTDLVNDDLQNKDVAEFSVGDLGLKFARTEVNDQSEAGLFELDVRNINKLETNFGGGDDTAVIKDNIIKRTALDLDGGDGIDLLDFSEAAFAVNVDLALGTITDARDVLKGAASEGVISSGTAGVPVNPAEVGVTPFKVGGSTAVNFENVTGTDFDDTITGNDQDNVIRGGAGNDTLSGGDGADTFVFFEEDAGVDIILDFNFAEDTLLFQTTDPDVTTDNLLANLTQVGEDVELALNNKVITFEDTVVTDFYADDFMIA